VLRTAICANCGCSLLRLGVSREDASRHVHAGEELLFCCAGCRDLFVLDPAARLAEVRDVVVCPVCLAEKPKARAVSVEHDSETVWLCRCAGCRERFVADPDPLLARLGA
jgi:hypothetical protein